MFNINEHFSALPHESYEGLITMATIFLCMLSAITCVALINCDKGKLANIALGFFAITLFGGLILGANASEKDRQQDDANATTVSHQLQDWAQDRYDITLTDDQALMIVKEPDAGNFLEVDGQTISYTTDQASTVILTDISQTELPVKN